MKSLQTRLQIWLIGFLLLGACSAAVAIYYKTRHEVAIMQDNSLKQIALALQSSLKWQHDMHQPLLINNQEQEEEGNDDEDLEYVGQIWNQQKQLILSTNTNKHIPFFNINGYETVLNQNERLRVYGLTVDQYKIEISQPTKARNIVAITTAQRALMPLLMVVPFLSIIIWLLVYFLFKPVKNISKQLQHREIFSTEAICNVNVPKELKPLIESLNGLLIRLNKAIKQQQQLIGDAAHTLRTPLTALTLQADILQRELIDCDRKELVYPIQEGIERLRHSVDQLLTYAKQDLDNPNIPIQPVALKPLVKSIISEFNSLALSRSIDLGLTDRTNVFVMGNDSALRALIENLIHNALNYCPSGSQVDLSLTKENQHAIITVTDNGPGIDPSLHERVFDRFYRGPNQDIQGTGLGLAIAKLIVEKHHGQIKLDTNPLGSGLRVTITLPSLPVDSHSYVV
ncbi:MAG: hypothetical protein KGI88_00945 [Betaproteobacteria bacterium]|nr:hypothetical protein [Betaproteobacteria bacterium]